MIPNRPKKKVPIHVPTDDGVGGFEGSDLIPDDLGVDGDLGLLAERRLLVGRIAEGSMQLSVVVGVLLGVGVE